MFKSLVFVFVILMVGASVSQELGSTINFRGDWEAGLYGPGNWAGLEWARPNVSIKLVTDPVRQGKYAARFEVTQDDYINSGERAEASGMKNATGATDRSENVPGTVFFYAFSVYIPSPFVPGTSWTILLQMHGPNTPPYAGASPSFALSAQKVYSIHVNGGMKNTTADNYRNAEYKFNDYVPGSGDIITDSWEDFVFEIKWDIQNKAYVNGWRRRWGQGEKEFTQVLRVTNESTLMYDQTFTVNGNGTGGLVRDAHYWKHGIYRGSAHVTTNATIAVLDGFTRALTFEDAVYGAFGDEPVVPSAAPSGQSNQPSSNAPGTRTPSTITSSTSNIVASVAGAVIVLFSALC